MVNCDCGWDTTTPIIQGDVNITYNQSANKASYIADFPVRRDKVNNIDTTAFSVQALAVYDNIALMVLDSAADSNYQHNMVVTMDLQTQLIIDRRDDFLPQNLHWNSACVMGLDSGNVRILLTAGQDQCYINMQPAGVLVSTDTGYSSTVSVGGVTYDSTNGILYGHSAGTFYVMTLSGKIFDCEQLFDGKPIIQKMSNWLYPGFLTHSQECEYHDGILYSIFSHPNAAFKFTPQGVFLGVDSIPYHVNGHPFGELENIAWSDYYNCFICNSQGRANDNFEPGHYWWGRVFVWAWGGAAADNWRVEYSRNDGQPDNVLVGGVKQIYATAHFPLAKPIAGDNCRHDGTPQKPFQFVTDAVYMAASIERDSSHAECHLICSGDFAAYEAGSYNQAEDTGAGITIPANLRIVLETDTTHLPRINVANSAAVDFVPGATAGIIDRLNCSRNSVVSCGVNCYNVIVSPGAVFSGNNLGAVVLYVDSNGLARIGGTNTTFTAGGYKHPNGIIVAPASYDVTNISGISATNLKMYGVDFT